jgi:hypothetical protein
LSKPQAFQFTAPSVANKQEYTAFSFILHPQHGARQSKAVEALISGDVE